MASSSEKYLIEEGVDWFQSLLSNYKNKENVGQESQESQDIDIIALTLHGFMIELGFQVEDRTEVPSDWKNPAGYSFKYWYLPRREASISLSVTSMGPLIKVHGINKTTKDIYTASILYSNFIRETGAVKNPAQLARLFKNEVGLPLLKSVRIDLGLSMGLANFAPEILLLIIKYLDVKSLLSLSRTSSQFNSLSKEENIWKYYFSRDFGDKNRNMEDGGNWRSRYSEEFKKEREMRRRRTNPEPRLPIGGGLFPHVPIPDFSSDPGPPPSFPGMVGGDYDRFPVGGLGNPLYPNLRLPRPRFDPPGPNFPGRDPFGGGRGGHRGGFGGSGGFGGFF